MKKYYLPLLILLAFSLSCFCQVLDPSFGSGGKASPLLNGFSSSSLNNVMALQADGKIVTAGYYYNGSNYDFAVTRLNSDGTVDNSFDGDGMKTIDNGYNEYAYAVAVQPDGKIVLTGHNYYYYAYSCNCTGGWGGGCSTCYTYYYDVMAVRLNADGSLDNTFDGDGIKLIDLNQTDLAYALALQPDGKIVIGGYSVSGNANFMLIRLNEDGSLDDSFNGTGFNISTDFGSYDDVVFSLQIQNDGKILAAGYGYTSPGYDFALARFNSNGSLDNSFDGDGKKTIDLSGTGNYNTGYSLALQADNKIIIAGRSDNSGTSGDFGIVRLNTDGSLDNSFDGNGIKTIDFTINYDEGRAVVIQDDGKIIISGQIYNGSNYNMGFVRLNQDGSLDNSFGSGGKFTIDFNSGYDFANSLLLQPDGKLLAGTYANGFGIIRLNLNTVTTLSCPGNVTANTDAGLCTAIVNNIDPIVSPSNALVNFKIEKDGVETESGTGSVSGETFSKGVATVTYSLADDPTKTCSFTVTIEDKENPNAIAQNITVQLDENGTVSITPAQINNGSKDNCTSMENLQLSLDKTNFDCSNLGANTVTLTVTDENNNSSTATAAVTVEDKLQPVADVATLPDLTGECSVSVSTNPTATDNCKGAITATTTDPLTYTAQGEYTITWTYDDGNGNTSTQTQKVIVKDETKPAPDASTLPDLTAECSLTVSAYPTATDNCKGSITATTDDPLSYTEQGDYVIHWKYDDGNGNVTMQEQNVKIHDITKPYFDAIADKIIIMNPATCAGKVPNLKLGLTGTDNCGGTVSFSQSELEGEDYATSNGAVKMVTITADDGNGNTFSRDVKLISKDDAAPTFACPADRNVSLGSSCSIVVPDLITGLTGDAHCGVLSFNQLPIAGTVISSSSNNMHTVVVTASDGNGNSTSCNVILTAKDLTVPDITCPAPKTISCDASSLPANRSTATATDNCDANPGITYTDASTQDPDVNHSAHYNYTITRTWKAMDNAGNANTCDQTITVQDVTAPTAKCKSINVYLGLDGTVSITAADVDDGSNDNCGPVSVSIDKTSFNATNVGDNSVVLTVTDVSGNSSTCMATVTVKKRPTTLVYTGDGAEQYSDQQLLTAVLKDQLTNTVLSSKLISFVLGSQSASGTTNVSGIASANLILTQDPAPDYTVKSSFAGDDIFLPSSDEDAFDITREDARAYYTGSLFASTLGISNSNATITLSATIKDITAVTGDAAYDGFGGDIRNATVSFIDRDANTVIATVPVGLVSSGNTKLGTAAYNWNVNIGTADSRQYTIGIRINNYYTRDASEENAVVTVSKPLDDFITGGGYIIIQSSAGIKNATVGTNNNFGFNVKYNKKGTNLQGNINTIFRRMEDDGLHVYQIKGNAMTSLSVNTAKTAAHPYPTAIFNGKANVQDITDPYAPVSVDGTGGSLLQVAMTDAGEPGTSDKIAITVWNKDGGLWFASNWNSTKTIEQLLDGGNLKANGGSFSSGTTLTKIAAKEIVRNEAVEGLTIRTSPNPSTGYFNVQVQSSDARQKIMLRVVDVQGRITELRSDVQSGQTVKMGERLRPGVYVIEAVQGKQKQTVKIIKLPD